jgi:antitoxin (DNA-binding transcriptional repressor) of toxin-antitoxin stability system
MPEQIGVCELKNQARRILRAVGEDMAEFVITLHGEPIAVLRPLTPDELEALRLAEANKSLIEMKSLAEQIAAAWTSSRSGVDLVSEQRR